MSSGLKFIGGLMQFAGVMSIIANYIFSMFGSAVNILDLVLAIGFVVAGAAISRAGKHLEKPVPAVKKDELEPFPPGAMASS